MSALTDFLLARIAEDQEIAAASSDPSWSWAEAFDGGEYTDIVDGTGRTLVADSPLNEMEAVHIARWDPKRVLAECEAKRRIVTECVEKIDSGSDEDGNVMTSGGHLGEWILSQLALSYADHPDYREEWRP